PGNWRHSSSWLIESAVVSTQSIRSLSDASAVPGHVSLSGQLPHHVICCVGLHFRLPLSHVLPSTALQPGVFSQVVRSLSRVHEFPVPHWQQNPTDGDGSRLPHLFLIRA